MVRACSVPAHAPPSSGNISPWFCVLWKSCFVVKSSLGILSGVWSQTWLSKRNQSCLPLHSHNSILYCYLFLCLDFGLTLFIYFFEYLFILCVCVYGCSLCVFKSSFKSLWRSGMTSDPLEEWVLETEPGSSIRASALHCWDIPSAPTLNPVTCLLEKKVLEIRVLAWGSWQWHGSKTDRCLQKQNCSSIRTTEKPQSLREWR